MTKAEFLDIIKDYPDDTEMKFTEESGNEQKELCLISMTEKPGGGYINFWFIPTT